MERFDRTPTGPRRPWRPRHWLPGGLVSAALLALVVVLLAPAAQVMGAAPSTVEIKDSRYLPATLTVPAGTTVRWINRDEETHNIASTAKLFKSGGLNLDDEFAYTFTTPGEYPYYCGLHRLMRGTIVVK